LLTKEEKEKLKAELQKDKSEKAAEIRKKSEAFLKEMENGPIIRI